MHRTDRFLFRPFSRLFPATLLHGVCAAALGLCVAALSAGCTLVTDVDRSKIPAAEVIPPDPAPTPQVDAGTPPAAPNDAGSNAVDAGDAGAGDAG